MSPTSDDAPRAALALWPDVPAPGHDAHVAETEVAALLDRHYGLAGTLTRLATEKDDSFRLDADGRGRWLVKVSALDESPATVSLQTSAMTWLERTAPGLAVQRVRRAADGRCFVPVAHKEPRTLRVLQWVDGLPWAECGRVAAPTLRAVSTLHAETTTALAGFAHEAAKRHMLWDVRNLPRLRPMLDLINDRAHRGAAEALMNRFETEVSPQLPGCEQQVLHSDVSPFNVILEPVGDDAPRVAGLIDFGDVVHSALVCDIAVPLANCLDAEDVDPWAAPLAYLDAYRAVRAIAAHELRLLTWAVPGRLLMRILLTEVRAGHSPERADYLRSHARADWANFEAALQSSESELGQRLCAPPTIHDAGT